MKRLNKVNEKTFNLRFIGVLLSFATCNYFVINGF